MLRSVWAIGSLLLSAGLLLFGHGMHLTLLPQVAESLAWSAAANALTTSAYFLGFAAGCLIVPRWLLRIGHIRVFGVLVSVATGTLLALSLVPLIPAWLVLRFFYGIAISGIYLSVESWLNAATHTSHRGTVLSIYAFVTLLAIFGAQMLLQQSALEQVRLLVLAAVFLCLAALPVGLTRREAPRLVATPHFRVSRLLNPANLPAFASGLLAGTFWALAPVYTTRSGFDAQDTARFMAATVGGGMAAVYPLGWLSDRIGRATVLSGLGLAGLLLTLAFMLFGADQDAALMVFALAFGAAMMPLYALCVALANDGAGNDDFVQTGSIVIMANALGMVVGPILAGWLMTGRSPVVLLWFWVGSFAALGTVSALIRARSAVESGTAAAFELVPRTVPEALEIDPRAAPAAAAAEEADVDAAVLAGAREGEEGARAAGGGER